MKKEVHNILERTLGIYLKYGIRSVTMDDVARELGVSKKTLYLHFENKKDLVYQTMKHYVETEKQIIGEINKNASNAIEELFRICDFVCQVLKERNPSVMFDLQKHYPDTWSLFLQHKQEFVYSNMVDNIKKGIEQGLFRDDFDIKVIAKLYVSRIEAMIDNTLFPFDKFPLIHVKNEMLNYHIRGIATAKGLRQLEKIKTRLYATST